MTPPSSGALPSSIGSVSVSSLSLPNGALPGTVTGAKPVGGATGSSSAFGDVSTLDFYNENDDCIRSKVGTKEGSGCSTKSLKDEADRLEKQIDHTTDNKKRAELEFELSKVYARMQDVRFYIKTGVSVFTYVAEVVKSNFYGSFNDAQKANFWKVISAGVGNGTIGGRDMRMLATIFKNFDVSGKLNTKSLAQELLSLGDPLNGSGRYGGQAGGGFGVLDAASIAVGFTPAGDVLAVVGAITGYDPITGKPLVGIERWLGLLGLVALGGEAVALAKAGTAAARAARVERAADKGSDIVRAIKDCANSFTANTKVWVSRAANDLASKTKSVLEKSARTAKTVARTALAAVAIFTVGVGTPVLALNEKTKLESIQTVTATMVHVDSEIVKLTLETDAGVREIIETTPEHPFAVRSQNGGIAWVNAIDLKKDQNLARVDGRSGKLIERVVVSREEQMYNLSVARDHTFFVGDGQWLVHNTGCTIVALAKGGIIRDGMTLGTDEALDLAEEFLGPGYRDAGNGRFVSADGTRQVRMKDVDLLPNKGCPHLNFEILTPNPRNPSKPLPTTNIHICLKP